MNIAFAGLRHGHIFDVYKMTASHGEYTVIGAFEEDSVARERAESLGVRCNYHAFEDVLSDSRVEAVALGGCYGHRGKMAAEALRAGKHVISDKPLCTTLGELDEIRKAADESGCKVSCVLTMRYEPKMLAARELFCSGELGEINNITFGGQHPLQYGRRPMWYFEQGLHGGVINDIAIHAIDFFSFAFGMKSFGILGARCWNRYASEAVDFLDSAQLMLRADNGAGIIGDVSYAIPDGVEFSLPMYWQFTVWGTGGVLDFSLGGRELLFWKKGQKEAIALGEIAPEHDCMTDFLRLTRGEDGVFLTQEEVFAATENTLRIQAAAVNG